MMNLKEAAKYLDIPQHIAEEVSLTEVKEGYKQDFKRQELEHELRHEKSKHDTGGFRISDSDAKKAKERLKKKYGKFARHFREFVDIDEARKMYDGGRAAKTGWNCGDCGAEKNRSDQCRSCGSPKRFHKVNESHASMDRMADNWNDHADHKHPKVQKHIKAAEKAYNSKDHEGFFHHTQRAMDNAHTLSQQAKKKSVKEDLKKDFQKASDAGDNLRKFVKGKAKKKEQLRKINRSANMPAGYENLKAGYEPEGQDIKEEQKRVIESLAQLASSGLNHKPIQKKKSKIDPGKAVRSAAAERLQKQAKAETKNTTVKQKFGEAYPVYKTQEYMDRPGRATRQAVYNIDKAAKKISKKKVTKKAEKTTPTMKDVKKSMWGEGFKDQFEPEYSEAKRRLTNKIRAKVGMKKKPVLDWKKERFGKLAHAHEATHDVHRTIIVPTENQNDRTHQPPKKKKIKEDAASGRPIKKPVKKVNKKDSGKDGSFVFTSPKSNVIGSYQLRNKVGARLGLKPIVAETAEYKAAMGPGSHEWGTDIGRDYFKKLTPGQDNPPEDPIKPLNIKARKPQDEKGVKVTETKLPPHLAKFINPKTGNLKAKYEKRIKTGKKPTFTVKDVTPKGYGPVEEEFSLDHIVAKQAEHSKEKYPEDNEVNAQWQANIDGILTGAYEGGEITWADVEALDKEAENITWDQEVDMGLYDDDELDMVDFDGDPLNDVNIIEVLSVQGRMKRRFAARRNRQKLKVARGIALRRGSTPDRIKKRATRGARLMVYKRLLRGRSRATLPPAEKERLERMITRFAPLVNRISVKLMPQIRKNEIKRMGNRGKKAATTSKKFKAAKPIRGAASAKAKRYKIKKPGKYKAPKPKKFKSAHRTGGPTLKRKSKAYKAFSYSVG